MKRPARADSSFVPMAFDAGHMSATPEIVHPSKAVRRAVAAAVVLPYLVSLGLPAVTGSIDAPDTTAPGLQALVMGFVVNPVVWFANVLLPIGLVQLHVDRLKSAMLTSAGAGICAALPLIRPLGLALEVGYYVWLSGMVILLVGSCLCWHLRRRAEPSRFGPGSTPV